MENYSIIDIDSYAEAIRENAAKSFCEDYSENLDNFITIQQVINLVKKHSLGKDEYGYYIINEEIFDDTFNDIREWLYGVGLAKLAAKGYVECAWDSKKNEMIFWLSDENNTIISTKPSSLSE